MLFPRNDLFWLICPVITQDPLVNKLAPLRLRARLSRLSCVRFCLRGLIRSSHLRHLASGSAASGVCLALPPQYAANGQSTDKQKGEDQHDDAAPTAPWFVVLVIVVKFAIGLRVITRRAATIAPGQCVIERIVKSGAQVVTRLGWRGF